MPYRFRPLARQVIMATNRADTLDPALLRPGRLDRKIEFPVPDRRQKRMVFTACTAKMNLSEVRSIARIYSTASSPSHAGMAR